MYINELIIVIKKYLSLKTDIQCKDRYIYIHKNGYCIQNVLKNVLHCTVDFKIVFSRLLQPVRPVFISSCFVPLKAIFSPV